MIDLNPASHRMTTLLAGVADHQLSLPTACTDYTVSDLINHIDLVSQGFTDLARKESSEPTATSLDCGWRTSIADHVRALGAAWAAPTAWEGTTPVPGLDLPNRRWGQIALTELVVHGWDLAKATGQPFDLPGDTLLACLDHVTEFIPTAPVPALWGPPVEVPRNAPLLDRIVATTGRTP